MLEQIKSEYFAKRRENLLDQVVDNSVIIIPANNELLRNGDAYYSFRQDSNFYYLSGFSEPDAVLVILKNKSDNKYILFVRPSDPAKEQWDGRRAGLAGAKTVYQADESYNIEELDTKMLDFIKNRSKLYYDLGCNTHFDQRVISWLNSVKGMQRKGISSPDEIVNLDNLLAEMRLIKDEYEQELMQKAASISAAGHVKAIKAAKNLEFEYQLEAEMVYECVKHGAKQQAYNPIVGSGENTCILHYGENNQKIDKKGLILIDAGAEYCHYAADITRTFPASGKFNTEQKAIYELVLSAQLAAIETIKPGNTWEQAQKVIIEIITSGLVELDIIESNGKSVDDLINSEAYKPFYMHNSGHWLGIDVHDAGSYKINNNWRELKPGMVLTVEPGIYIKANMENVDPKWWNIGVRIEDDILVTEHGHNVLTKEVPKQIHEIEELMS